LVITGHYAQSGIANMGSLYISSPAVDIPETQRKPGLGAVSMVSLMYINPDCDVDAE